MANSKKPAAQGSLRSDRYVPLHLQPLIKGIQGLYNSQKDTDLLVKCGGREWKVHRAIVRPQWPFLDRALEDFKEGQDGMVELKEDDPQVVDLLINYFYTFDYAAARADIVSDVRMFIIADKYLIKPLCTLAEAKFKHNCNDKWSSREFADALRELYTNGPHCTVLREIGINAIQKFSSLLLDEDRREEYARFNHVLETTELGADLCRAEHELRIKESRIIYKCPNCNTSFSVDLPAGSNGWMTCPRSCRFHHKSWWDENAVASDE